MALTDNLVSYWKLDESSGNAADSVGSNTLTNTGTMTYGTGKINNGAVLAAGKYLSRSSAVLTAVNNISTSFWVNIPDTSETGGFVRIGSIAGSDGWGCGVGGTRYDNAGNNLIVLIDGVAWRSFGALGAAGWKHCVITRGATTWKAYVNGVQLGSTFTDTPVAPSAVTYIGNDQADWAGTIDEIGFWNRELTAGEVSQLWNGGNGSQYAFTDVGIARDTFLIRTAQTSASWSASYTVTGSNPALVVFAEHSSGETVTSATYNGVALTIVNSITVYTGTAVTALILIAPATGANTLTVNFSASSTHNVMAESYSGVFSGGNTGGSDSKNTSTWSASSANQSIVTTTIANNSWLVIYLRSDGGTYTASTNVSIQNNVANIALMGDNNAAITPAGATTQTFTATGTNSGGMLTVGLAGSAAASANSNFFQFF